VMGKRDIKKKTKTLQCNHEQCIPKMVVKHHLHFEYALRASVFVSMCINTNECPHPTNILYKVYVHGKA
jgi:hypothetical protein